MKSKRLTFSQRVNFSTLISIAVIETILTATNEEEIEGGIQRANTKYYHSDVLEIEKAYSQHFSQVFAKPEELGPINNTEIDDSDAQPFLQSQIRTIISQLKESRGVTLSMNGHTISLTRRGGTYYSFDSYTGYLSSTTVQQEMIDHLWEKTVKPMEKPMNHIWAKTTKDRGIIAYYFTANSELALRTQQKESTSGTTSSSSPRQDLNSQTKLIEIIDTLKKNISTQQNGRLTANNSDWKVGLFGDISTRLEGEQELTPDTKLRYIEEIREVCAKKRNIFHFWSQPHSVGEFEDLLDQNKLATQVGQEINDNTLG